MTADQLRGRVAVQIDGEEQFLRFDQSALANVIEKLGLDGVSGLPSAVGTLDGDTLAVLVWAGRRWQDESVALEDVRGWFYPLMPTYHATIEALNLALWGQPEPLVTDDDGGSDDAADPIPAKASGKNGTSRKPRASRSRASGSRAKRSGK